MPTEKEFISGFLSKTLNMDNEAVSALYNADGSLKEDVVSLLESKDAERVKRIKEEATKDAFNDGRLKSKAETLTKFEKEFKEKTGFKSDKQGVELILAWGEELQKSSKSELTDDVIKKHPIYLNMLEAKEKEKTDAIINKENEFNQFKSEIKNKETFTSVSNKALEAFNSLKPILSTDQNKAKAQQELFIEKLKGFEYEIQENRIVVLKDGKPYEDKHGNPVKFENLVRDIADKYYDFHKGESRSSSGNGGDNRGLGGSDKKFVFDVPKNDVEYAKAISDKNLSVEERSAIQDAYKSSKAQAN